jgi:hypothetical protein
MIPERGGGKKLCATPVVIVSFLETGLCGFINRVFETAKQKTFALLGFGRVLVRSADPSHRRFEPGRSGAAGISGASPRRTELLPIREATNHPDNAGGRDPAARSRLCPFARSGVCREHRHRKHHLLEINNAAHFYRSQKALR